MARPNLIEVLANPKKRKLPSETRCISIARAHRDALRVLLAPPKAATRSAQGKAAKQRGPKRRRVACTTADVIRSARKGKR